MTPLGSSQRPRARVSLAQRLGLLCLAGALALSSALSAQPPAPAPPPVAPAPVPPALLLDDPMLQPAERATRTLGSFDEALGFIRARSTELGKAQVEIRRAEAGTRTALAALLPSINGQATATHQFITRQTMTMSGSPATGLTPRTTTTPQSDYINGGVTLVQPLVNTQAWYNLGTARRGEQLAGSNLQALKRAVTSGIATSIVGVVAAERLAELNRLGLRAALERALLTERKRALGVGNGLDTVRADQDVAAARGAVVSGDESLRQAREGLGLALGVGGQMGVAEGLALNGLLDEVQRACPAGRAMSDRADYIAAQQQLELTQRNIHSVELSFLPTLQAQSTIASTTADVGMSPRTTWNLQAVLAVPIWDGGVRYGSLRSTRALRDEAAYDVEAKRRGISLEIAQAGRATRVASQALTVARGSERLAVEADRLTQLAFRAGQATSFELIATAGAVRQAEVNLVLKEFELVSAKVQALMVLSHCSDKAP